MRNPTGSRLPLARYAADWEQFYDEYPPPDVFAETVYLWPKQRIRELQNRRFLEVMQAGWQNAFYQSLWKKAGIEPGDIASLDDIVKLPVYNSDDLKADQQSHPPYGLLCGFSSVAEHLRHSPLKLQTSGGTTGKPRNTLYGIREWEYIAVSSARVFYMIGVRPGDVMQIPVTCSLAMLGWPIYKACHEYLGVLPITTGSGVVTPSRRQVEVAFDFGVTHWLSFPEYLIRLAQASREEFGRDIRELKSKSILSFLGPDTDGSLRGELERLYGCPVYDNYGTNEVGAGAFECQQRNGLHFMEDAMYFEVLDTETGKPVLPGRVGNLVVTAFPRRMMPCSRFDLRDLARIVSEDRCGCGSHFRRMDHLLGRSDAMVKLRGVNVYPMACLPAIRSDARTTGEWLCEVFSDASGGAPRDEMTVHVEVRRDAPALDGLKETLEARLKADLGVSVAVRLVGPGELQTAAHLGEGKASRLLERRPAYLKK